MGEKNMKRLALLTALVAGLVLAAACQNKSPAAPPQATPAGYALSLTASPSVAGVNEVITLVAQVTSGGQNVADGFTVSFTTDLGAFVESSQTQASVTTTSGRATVHLVSDTGADGTVTARVPGVAVPVAIHFRGYGPAAVAIFGVLPSRGNPQGGDRVTIQGRGFVSLAVPGVTFITGGAAYPAQIVDQAADGSYLTVITPAIGQPSVQDRVADVAVKTTAATATLTGGFIFSATTGVPMLYKVSPQSASARGGDIVTLTGKYFTEPINVIFHFTANGVSKDLPAQVLAVTHGSDGTDTAKVQVPQASIGVVTQAVAVNIEIRNMVSSSNPQSATYPQVFFYSIDGSPPSLFYISPTLGSAAGNEVITLVGAYLVQPLTVKIGVVSEQVLSVSVDGTQATVLTSAFNGTVPVQAQDVTVTTLYGTATLAGAFTYKESQAPQIFSLSPESGPIEGGTQVTIIGQGFQTPVQVFFGDRQAQMLSSNYSEIVCVSPSISVTQPASPTTVAVTVLNTTSGQRSGSVNFRYGEAIFISAIGPGVGPDTGGTTVTIYGQGFSAPVAVTLAGVPATVGSVAGTEVIVRSGGVVARSCNDISGPVQVTNINSNTSASGVSFTYTPAKPAIVGVSVSGTGASGNSIPQVGTSCASGTYTVTLTGQYFEMISSGAGSAMRITLGSTPPISTTTTFVSPSQVTFVVPSLAGMTFNTATCVIIPGTNGTIAVDTPVDITITNLNNGCTDTLKSGLIVHPCNPTCQ
jgi:hypothetical protein